MKSHALFYALLFQGSLLAQDYHTLPKPQEIMKSARVSDYCKMLTEKRQTKIELKRRTLDILKDNRNMQKATPKERQKAKAILEVSEVKATEKIKELDRDLERMNKTMIMQGCPGVAYRVEKQKLPEPTNPDALEDYPDLEKYNEPMPLYPEGKKAEIEFKEKDPVSELPKDLELDDDLDLESFEGLGELSEPAPPQKQTQKAEVDELNNVDELDELDFEDLEEGAID